MFTINSVIEHLERIYDLVSRVISFSVYVFWWTMLTINVSIAFKQMSYIRLGLHHLLFDSNNHIYFLYYFLLLHVFLTSDKYLYFGLPLPSLNNKYNTLKKLQQHSRRNRQLWNPKGHQDTLFVVKILKIDEIRETVTVVSELLTVIIDCACAAANIIRTCIDFPLGVIDGQFRK